MIRRASVAWLAAISIVAGITGCQTLAFSVPDGSAPSPLANVAGPVPVTADPIMGFVAGAADGTRINAVDPATGAPVQVVAGRRYAAASGTTCREYTISGSTGVRTHLACIADDGSWGRRPMVVAPGLLVPRRS